MKIHELSTTKSKSIKRLGRGISGGQGKTAGRGTKGQNSRTGSKFKPGFEGGQTKLAMRLPKARGFKALNRTEYRVVNISDLEDLAKKTVDAKVLEDAGVILPVVDLHIKYLRPAKYDDLITIKTIIKELPVDHKITFHQEVYNELGKLLTVGTVKLYFMDQKLQNKAVMPSIMLEKLRSYF